MAILTAALRKAAWRIVKDVTLGIEFPARYRRAVKKHPEVSKTALFVNVKLDDIPDSFSLLAPMLQNEYGFDVCHMALNQAGTSYFAYHKACRRFVEQAACASWIVLEDASDLVSCLPLRAETRVAQLWHACGAFKKWGHSTSKLKFGASERAQARHPYYGNLDIVTVSSSEVRWAYEEAMGISRESGIVEPIGVSRTDAFFDPEFVASSTAKVRALFPAIDDRRLVLYAPTFRGPVKGAKGPDALDWELLKERVGSDYAIIVKHHPFVANPPAIPESCGGFAFRAREGISTAELLCAADILITDYSSIVFEYSLMNRPMGFFAFDLESYGDWRGFYYDFDEMTPGPVLRSTPEVASFLENPFDYRDPDQTAAFRSKFMGACDGRSTKRIANYIAQNTHLDAKA